MKVLSPFIMGLDASYWALDKVCILKIQQQKTKQKSFSRLANSQYFFLKISGIGAWMCRTDWWEGHWCCSTYLVVRLSDISSKTGKNAFFVFLGCFWAYAGQLHNHIASINSTNPRTNPKNFHKKILRIGWAGKWPFFRRLFWIFFASSYQKTHQDWVSYV